MPWIVIQRGNSLTCSDCGYRHDNEEYSEASRARLDDHDDLEPNYDSPLHAEWEEQRDAIEADADWNDPQMWREEGEYFCDPECASNYFYADGDYPDEEDGDSGGDHEEVIDREEVEIAIAVESLPDRPIRLTSWEIEVGSGRRYIAEMMHNVGASDDDYVKSYASSRNSIRTDRPIHVEEDSSVNGEVITSMVMLDSTDGPGLKRLRLAEAGMCSLRAAVKEGSASLDSRCGLHIHVDASGLSMRSISNLYHLWNHCEHVVFALGSAFWNQHRTRSGNGYALPTRKGLTVNGEQGRNLSAVGRSSLHLSNYLYAIRECDCGAYANGRWEDCHCAHGGKRTIEFRVFNSTVNLRKLRAYLALTQALVAYAENHDVNEATHPVMAFDEDWTVKEVADRFGWMIDNLPLTAQDRADLFYVARNSPHSLSEAARTFSLSL
jgi:hypothetical protein